MALFFMLKNCYNNERKAYDFMKQQKYNFKDLTLAYFQKNRNCIVQVDINMPLH